VSVCLPASVRLLIPLGAELVSELPRLGISALPVAAFELAEQIALAELIADPAKAKIARTHMRNSLKVNFV
jgi:hypothetical protein